MNYKDVLNVLKTEPKFNCDDCGHKLFKCIYKDKTFDYFCSKCYNNRNYVFFEKDICCVCLEETYFKTLCKHALCPKCCEEMLKLTLDHTDIDCPLCRNMVLSVDCCHNDDVYGVICDLGDYKHKLYFNCQFDNLLLNKKYNEISEILNTMYKKSDSVYYIKYFV